MPQLHNDVREALNLALLNLTSCLNRSQQQAYRNNNLQIRTRKFHGFTTYKCRPQLLQLADNINNHHSDNVVQWPTPATTRHYYACPQKHNKKACEPFD
eukprot:4449914-Karenia_brevis.AAC.1